MQYDIDENAIDLDALQQRLENTDLIPSQEPLRDKLDEKLTAIGKARIKSMGDLRNALKTDKSLALLAKESGVDVTYLQLLKRTVNGFLPKPRPLKTFDWIGRDTINKLREQGIKNTRQLFIAASEDTGAFAKRTGISQVDAAALFAVSDLCRIQWVSPPFARALVAAGATNPAAVARADPKALSKSVEKANQDATFFKVKVGLRDIKRLVAAARYVP